MIARLGNMQVGKGQYLYKTGRCICGTKKTEPMNGLEMSGCVHRLVKAEQSKEDNKQVIKGEQRMKETYSSFT